MTVICIKGFKSKIVIFWLLKWATNSDEIYLRLKCAVFYYWQLRLKNKHWQGHIAVYFTNYITTIWLSDYETHIATQTKTNNILVKLIYNPEFAWFFKERK